MKNQRLKARRLKNARKYVLAKRDDFSVEKSSYDLVNFETNEKSEF